MKDFNLKQAFSGYPLITRNGNSVSQLTAFRIHDNTIQVAGVVNNKHILTWDVQGKCNQSYDYDLFMVSKTKHFWVYLIRTDDGSYKISELFDCKNTCIESSKQIPDNYLLAGFNEVSCEEDIEWTQTEVDIRDSQVYNDIFNDNLNGVNNDRNRPSSCISC